MRKILIATHSTFAEGIANSVQLLVGEQANLTVINAYVDDSDYTEIIDHFFVDVAEVDEYIVFTDLYGGSVNQKLVGYKEKFAFHLITGFNLPIVLEVLLHNDKLTEAELDCLIDTCRLEMKRVVPAEIEDMDETDFL